MTSCARCGSTDDQEDVARLFERYDLVSAPVIDENDRLVGVITFDDIVDVIEEEAEEDIRALGGVGREEELSDSVWTIAKGRFPWLFANLLTALLASWVISNFEDALDKNGGAGGADADRRQHGRQCRHADHDRGGAGDRDPRALERQCLAHHPARASGRRAQRPLLRVDHGACCQHAGFKSPIWVWSSRWRW